MLTGYMQNPFGNPFFQTQQQLGTRQAQNLGGQGMSNLLRNITSSGMAGGASSPAGLEMQQNQTRANTGLQANLGFLNPVQNALGMQQWAGNLGAGYRPLQTGQTQQESTGGLGTWLPQLAGSALGLAMGNPGALSSMFGGGGGGMQQSFGGNAPGLWGSGSGGFAGLPTGAGQGNLPGAMFGGGGNPMLGAGGGAAPPFMGGTPVG